MSRRSRSFELPLKNITAAFNSNTMSYTGDSGFSNLTNSPMSNLAFNLSELSTGRSTPRLRRKLSLSSVDTPPNDNAKANLDASLSAESGCFSGSPLADSPTFDSLSIKRYAEALHPDIPPEAFSVKKKTIAFRRINSQPLPTLRLDSPTDFLEEDKDDSENVTSDQQESGSSHQCDKEHEDNLSCEPEENSQNSRPTRLLSEDACSQDSGLGFDHDRRNSMSSFDDAASISSCSSSSLNHIDRLPSLEELWNSPDSPGFKAPRGKPPKRSRSMLEDRQDSEETCSPIKYSPVKSSSLRRPSFSKALFSQIPEAAENAKSENDDGFQELFKIDDLKNEADTQVSSLISATLLHRPSEDNAEEPLLPEVKDQIAKFASAFSGHMEALSSRPIIHRRGLHRSQSLDIRPRPSFKRCEPPVDGTTPVQTKRWRGNEESDSDSSSTISEEESMMLIKARRIQRCHSETEATIKSAVSRMFLEPDLIGDCSKPYCLPTVRGKHQDLKSISPETLSRLLANEYLEEIEEFHIIDCRYPYEYDGGHIQYAMNIYTKDAVIEKYLKEPVTVRDPNKRIILIFHCEFSSERGPGLFRFLRQRDRETNKECYPFLHYPEIYLLEGGYKSFFEHYSHLCEPQRYLTMFDKNHSEDMRKFRAKCKSWTDEKTQARMGVRNLKF